MTDELIDIATLTAVIAEIAPQQTSASTFRTVLANGDSVTKRRVIFPRPSTLTAREIEVCAGLMQALSTRQIAGRMSVSVKTVEAHRAHIARKLGVAGREVLVALCRAYYTRLGWEQAMVALDDAEAVAR